MTHDVASVMASQIHVQVSTWSSLTSGDRENPPDSRGFQREGGEACCLVLRGSEGFWASSLRCVLTQRAYHVDPTWACAYRRARIGTGAMTQGGAGGIVQSPKQSSGRVVAVTGPRTFLGKNLLGLCEEDERIRRLIVIDHETPISAGTKTRSYAVDRTQPDAAAKLSEIFAAEAVDSVVHLGFLESPTRNTAWAHELESVGTLHLLNACREAGVKKLVLGSSTALYGPHSDNPNFLSEEHPLRGLRGTPFLTDKIDAERQFEAYARDVRGACVTVLRFAALLGPTVESYVTRWLSLRTVPTLLGFDPLVQCVHEVDALSALRLAVQRDVPGTFNIAADGVLPISTVIKLAGRTSFPVPHFMAHRLASVMWPLGLVDVPASMLRYLRHLCVADAARAKGALGVAPAYSTREAVLEFGATLRLREARLLTEAYG